MALRLGLSPDLPLSLTQWSSDRRYCQFGEVLRHNCVQVGSRFSRGLDNPSLMFLLLAESSYPGGSATMTGVDSKQTVDLALLLFDQLGRVPLPD